MTIATTGTLGVDFDDAVLGQGLPRWPKPPCAKPASTAATRRAPWPP
jgi:hypothetical protein